MCMPTWVRSCRRRDGRAGAVSRRHTDRRMARGGLSSETCRLATWRPRIICAWRTGGDAVIHALLTPRFHEASTRDDGRVDMQSYRTSTSASRQPWPRPERCLCLSQGGQRRGQGLSSPWRKWPLLTI